MSSNVAIRTGYWMDFSHATSGVGTYTLAQRDSSILSSAITVVLSLTGAQMWKVLVFIVHQIRFRTALADGLEHQQRVIFRNSVTPGSTAWLFFLQAFWWYDKVPRSLLRTVPWVLFAWAYVAAVAMMALLVPERIMSAASDLRLLEASSQCGTFHYETSDAYWRQVMKESQASSTYSQECYESTPDAMKCQTFPAATLRPMITRNVSCPFDAPKTCSVLTGSVPIQLMTPPLDSRDDFGMNFPDRVTYQNQMTCSILRISPQEVRLIPNSTSGGIADEVVYYFGSRASLPGDWDNETFIYNTLQSWPSIGKGYGIEPLVAYAGRTDVWVPSPNLNRTDADVTLVFLNTNAVLSPQKINDPLFISTTISNFTMPNMTFYGGDYYGSLVGCTSQHKICNVLNGQCSDLQGFYQVFNNNTYDSIGLSVTQRAIATRLQLGAFWSQLVQVINRGSASALRASDSLDDDNIQIGLPDDQYVAEFSAWYSTGLAMMQRQLWQFATGSPFNIEGLTQGWNAMNDSVGAALCQSQLTRLTHGTVSYSVTGLLVTFVCCAVIVLISYILELVVGSVQQGRKGSRPKDNWALWRMDESLQLQRLLFESLGFTRWSNAGWVPVTTSGQLMGSVDLTDPEHPRFHSKEGEDSLMTADPEKISHQQGQHQFFQQTPQNLGGQQYSQTSQHNPQHHQQGNWSIASPPTHIAAPSPSNHNTDYNANRYDEQDYNSTSHLKPSYSTYDPSQWGVRHFPAGSTLSTATSASVSTVTLTADTSYHGPIARSSYREDH